MRDISKIQISKTVSIRDAYRCLNDSGLGVLVLVNENGTFERTITDGDLRRLMLEVEDLDTNLTGLRKIESYSIRDDQPMRNAYLLMNKHKVNHIPVIDSSGRACGLYVRSDFDDPILLSTPHLSEFERDFVEQAFDTNWIAPLGPNVDGFEAELSAYLGIGSAAALSSGTAAIHLALDILGVEAGDYVFCSSLTFVASCNPIRYLGASPVFIDSEPGSWNMSADVLSAALKESARNSKLPKAVVVVNLYGHSADYDRIRAECEVYDVPIVEDAAESIGAHYKGRPSGTLGDLGIFSFNGNKIITTSGGGMIVSSNREYVDLARKLSTQAKDNAPFYLHSRIGYNYRMSNVLAGIGRGQLKVLNDRVKSRRKVYDAYRKALSKYDFLSWIDDPRECLSTHWLSLMLLPGTGKLTPSALIEYLGDRGIEARHVWNPMHKQPLFADCKFYASTNCVSDDLFARGICLPSGSNMSVEQQERIIESLCDYFDTV